MKIYLILIFNLSVLSLYAQKTKIYLFHGQGSDYRIYSKFEIDTSLYDTILFNYPKINKHHTMSSYAKEISQNIDTTNKYIFIGVSFGGMVTSELNRILKPEYAIIISSAQNKNEIPSRYKFMKYFPIHRVLPSIAYRGGAKIAQPIVESDRKHNKEIFKAMLKDKDPKFIKMVTKLMIGWETKALQNEIIHIHGTNDHTLPIKKCKVDYVVQDGSHMMLLTRANEINKIVFEIISQQ